MSILRKWLGFTAIQASDDADPFERQRQRETARVLEQERQELRQKIQRQQSASRVLNTASGALKLMENDRGRR